MAATSLHGVFLPKLSHSKSSFTHKDSNFSLTSSQTLSFKPNLSFNTNVLLPKLKVKRNSHASRVPTIFSIQSKVFKAIQTAYKVAKDGVEAGTNLVPDAVPRPIAKVSVAVVAGALSLFVIRSILSTVFFSAAFMGVIYFVYLALNKDKGPKIDGNPSSTSSTSTEDAVEEAKKIMEKYK